IVAFTAFVTDCTLKMAEQLSARTLFSTDWTEKMAEQLAARTLLRTDCTEKIVEQASARIALSTECTLKAVVQSRLTAVVGFSTLPQSTPAAPVAVTSSVRPGVVGRNAADTEQSTKNPNVPHVP